MNPTPYVIATWVGWIIIWSIAGWLIWNAIPWGFMGGLYALAVVIIALIASAMWWAFLAYSEDR